MYMKYVPGLGNIDRHGGYSGDQPTDHTGTEMTEYVVREVICKQIPH